jgi:hypothetical protein
MSHRNLLTTEEQEITYVPGLWEVSGTNTISRSSARWRVAPASLLLANTSSSSATCRLVRSIDVEPDKQYRLFAFGYSETPGTTFGVRAKTYLAASATPEATYESSTEASYQRWTLSSRVFTTGQDTASVDVELYAEGSPVWFDQVVLIEYHEKPYHAFTNLVMGRFPEYMIDSDEQTSYHLSRFVDLGVELGDEILSATLAFDYIPAVDGIPGYDRCTLVDPSYYPDETVAKAEWLPWLAQLVGVQGVRSGSSGRTPWFWLEEERGTWSEMETEIDPTANPVWPVSSFTRTAGVVTATLGTPQTSGPAYFPAIGDVVEVTNAEGFSGSYSVLTSDSGTKVLTWAQDASNGTSAATSSLRVSDSSWAEIEADNPLAFDTVAALAHLVRTRATGLRAGTDAAITAAVRAVLDGYESQGTARVYEGGGILVTTSAPHPFEAGDEAWIYDSAVPVFNTGWEPSPQTVSSVIDGQSFVLSSGLADLGYGTAACWVTNKKVVLERVSPLSWELTVKTDEAQTQGVDLVVRAANLAKPAGVVVSHGYNT